ncbi:hypothetical protein [Virgibacillus sp.]|uniref:hypothetical protein n=1 Tax=Virgibacillus sp. TaxID=1872700 RepID=UPI0017BE90AC|nr:hypothetical protein [Virgibacillus sp.]NWO12682.1 thrombospondin type 3 repeat-containing protein [Virgibacillus sp.]
MSNAESYKRYLNFVSVFSKDSLENQILIYKQKPNASLVASMEEWNKLGRKVNIGAKAIKMIDPERRYKVNVFDVKDTNGVFQPKNSVVPKNVTEREFADKIFQPLLKQLKKDLPIQLDTNYKKDSNGHYSELEHKIVLNANANKDVICKTLIQEYARSIFHSDTGKYHDLEIETKKIQSESTAYLVAKSLGMDTSEYSFPNFKEWSKGKSSKILMAYQEAIQKESAAIVKKVKDVILDHNISFDVPVILDRNKLAIKSGEKDIALIKYGSNYTIAVGEVREIDLYSLDRVKALGYNFTNQKDAENAFELVKGHIPLSKVTQLDTLKGNTHIYQRSLVDPKSKLTKSMYLVGIASMTNVKAITIPSPNLTAAEKVLNNLIDDRKLEVKTLNEHEKMEKDLANRDLDSDGLTDLQELRMGTNPVDPDTDGDGIPDNIDRNPRVSDTDRGIELELGL